MSNDNRAKIVRQWQVENLIGKVMLIVETMGLEKQQEESAKSLIKQSIWVEFNESYDISVEQQDKWYREQEEERLLGVVNNISSSGSVVNHTPTQVPRVKKG